MQDAKEQTALRDSIYDNIMNGNEGNIMSITIAELNEKKMVIYLGCGTKK